MMPYQDIYRHGQIIERGERECASRWESLRREYGAGRVIPLTVVDVGAAEGYFSVRWAETYRSTVVALDPSPALLETAQAHPELPLIVCRKTLTPADLWEFGRCEHVDLTLCLNVLHHFGADWAKAIEAVLTWGGALVFETPDPLDTRACHAVYLPDLFHALVKTLPSTIFARPQSHTSANHPRWMGRLLTAKSFLVSPYWEAPPGVQRPGAVYIYHDYAVPIAQDYKKFGAWPRKGGRRSWIPGINLATYLALDGRWPTREALAACVRQTVAALVVRHGDIHPWNWIVTGDPACPMQLIDYGDWTSDDAEGLAWTLKALEG